MAKILSIDDDPGLQDLVAEVLGREGHEVHWAFNGEEGYEKAQTFHPDLIILDMMLPTLNGMEVLRLLKAHKDLRDIPVVVVTAFSGEAAFKESAVRDLGAREYLQKPVPIDVLTTTVASLLGPTR